MRKRIEAGKNQKPADDDWLNVENIAEVVISSEHPQQPIEGALLPGEVNPGWQALEPGQQTIHLIFDQPQSLHRIWLEFVEATMTRTHEYVLRWSGDRGLTYQEIVRQQWNFSPEGGTKETEDYHVKLPAVTDLELTIVPDIGGGSSLASLQSLRLA